MEKTYWTLLSVSLCGLILSIVMIVLLAFLMFKGTISKKSFILYLFVLLFTICLSTKTIVPCLKDYKYVHNKTYIEEEATVIEFTYIHNNLDGNGKIQYSKPKFFVERTNEYIVLYTSEVDLGAKYKIRYYPNTKICEIQHQIE